MWTAAAAAILGVLVASATGGGAPPLWLLALLVALPGAITVGARLLRRSHRSRTFAYPYRERSAAVEPEAGPRGQTAPQRSNVDGGARTSARPIAQDDWDVVSEICRALDARQLDWFRSNDFVTPWLDFHARPVEELGSLVTQIVDRPFEADLRTALDTLAEAINAFVEYYRHNTFPDPLLLGEDWRFFEWDDRGLGDETGGEENQWAGRAARLQELAAGLAHAYAGFSATASRKPTVRQRIEARA